MLIESMQQVNNVFEYIPIFRQGIPDKTSIHRRIYFEIQDMTLVELLKEKGDHE
jgi:hypothetical protein